MEGKWDFYSFWAYIWAEHLRCIISSTILKQLIVFFLPQSCKLSEMMFQQLPEAKSPKGPSMVSKIVFFQNDRNTNILKA